MSSVLAALWRRPEHPCGCPGPCSEPQGPELGQGAPPCTFRRTPKRNGAACPAGGSSLIVAGLRSWWNAMQIWSGSGAQNSPGTVHKVTAWSHGVQIGYRRANPPAPLAQFRRVCSRQAGSRAPNRRSERPEL